MREYPTIEYYGTHWGTPIAAVDKLDGSNLRFEWSRKRGVHKFGTRHQMIDRTEPTFGFAIDIFLAKYAEGIERAMKTKENRDRQRITFYAELVSPSSQYGRIDPSRAAEFDTVLFDAEDHDRGFMLPWEFSDNFRELGIPRVVHVGNLNMELVRAVKNNEFGLTEGVICKPMHQPRKGRPIPYCKIKTDAWLDGLRAHSPDLHSAEMLQANKNT